MGFGMDEILTGVFIGNLMDAKDTGQLNKHNITHILTIHHNPRPVLKDKKYLCIVANDAASQDLSQYFRECCEFIHQARLEKGNVLIHCQCGVSRSVTVVAAYIMTVTDLGWQEALDAIRGARSVANPNPGFQQQLQHYETGNLTQEREAFRIRFPDNRFHDATECKALLKRYRSASKSDCYVSFGGSSDTNLTHDCFVFGTCIECIDGSMHHFSSDKTGDGEDCGGFRQRSGIPGLVGTLDGTHIQITAPEQ